MKNAEFLFLLILFLVNLRILNWFQPGYLVFSGDFRPPIVPNVFLQNALNSWNEVDWGIPSVYSPRLLDPFFLLMATFQSMGISAFISELMATYLIYVLAAVLMYFYIKRITKGDIIAAFIGALFFTSNIHLIVDREQTAIGFINMSLMILPSVVAFTEGLKRKSAGLVTLSGFFFILTYAAFPNYRALVLCLITLPMTAVALYVNRESKVDNAEKVSSRFFSLNLGFKFSKVPLNFDVIRKYAKYYSKYIAVFTIAALLASLWIIVLIWVNLDSLLSTLSLAWIPTSVFGNKSYDVVRLIAHWSIYSSYRGFPLVPYAAVYLQNPVMIVLSYVPTVLAFAAIFISKSRKLSFFFGSMTILFLLLTMGSSETFSQLYWFFIEKNPLMKAFRTSTNWIFMVILCFSILIGLSVSGLCHRTKRHILKSSAIVVAVALFFSTTYPLITGDVTQNWLDPKAKGSYVPPYFSEAENAMSNRHWTILLPPRDVYPLYNFTNLGVLAAGNPYPILLSKPFISGIGTEYIQPATTDLMTKVYGAILTGPHILMTPSIASASASSVENDRVPVAAIDRNYKTRWASKTGMPQWYEVEWKQSYEISSIKIIFEYVYANDYKIQTWNGNEWITQIEVANNTLFNPEHVFAQSVSTTKLRITFTKALPFNQVSIYELGINRQRDVQTELVPKLLGMLGIKNLLVEKNIIDGNFSNVEDVWILNEGNVISLVHEWNGASMYENKYSQEKIYFADSILPFSGFFEMCQVTNYKPWSTLQHSAFIETASETNWTSIVTMQMPKNYSWEQTSPTRYRINAQSNAPFLLAFLESYDSHWKAFVNGRPISENNHVKVNSFANGWIITDTGNLEITIEYEIQNQIATSVFASIILTTVFAIFTARKEIKKVAKLLAKTRSSPH